MSEPYTIETLTNLINGTKSPIVPTSEKRFITSGAGVSDETAIKYYANTNMPVLARDGKTYRRGEQNESENT